MKIKHFIVTTEKHSDFGNSYCVWDKKGNSPKPESEKTTEKYRKFIEKAINNHYFMLKALKVCKDALIENGMRNSADSLNKIISIVEVSK